MLEQTATVVQTDNDHAWVEAASRSACSACGSGSCTTSVLSKLFGVRRNRLRVDNPENLQVGQQVVIGIPEELLVRASVWAYLLPMLAMVAAAIMASAAGFSDGWQALAALAGLALGLLAVNSMMSGSRALKRFQPRLIRPASLVEIGATKFDLNKPLEE